MTVIMACTFPGGAAIAADTLFHNPDTKQHVLNSAKTLSIGNRVAIAQAGSFNGTQSVWGQLESLPAETATPSSVAVALRQFAEPIFDEKSRTSESAMRYLVAGIESDGTPAIHWLEFDNKNFGNALGQCQIAALGTLPNCRSVATNAALSSLKPNSNTVMLDLWCKQVISAEAHVSPNAVGFPATLVLMKESGMVEAQIEKDGPPISQLEVFWP